MTRVVDALSKRRSAAPHFQSILVSEVKKYHACDPALAPSPFAFSEPQTSRLWRGAFFFQCRKVAGWSRRRTLPSSTGSSRPELTIATGSYGTLYFEAGGTLCGLPTAL